MKAIKIAYLTDQEWAAASTPAALSATEYGKLSRGARAQPSERQSSRGPGAPVAPQVAAIREANFCVAVTVDNRANVAASCQGSSSSRASAERTLSPIPFLSSPIGAKRKLLNSGPGGEIEAERVVSITELSRPFGDPD